MLLLIILLIFTKLTYSADLKGGTAIFHNRCSRSECWNENDIAKLRARKTYERLLLPKVNPDKINGRYIKNTLRYYRRALKLIEKESDSQTARLLKEALLDTIGANFRSELLPNVRLAFYAGYISYIDARQVEDFFNTIKTDLNTQGLGWNRVRSLPNWSNLTISKVLIGAGTIFNPCSSLVTKRDSKTCIHIPIPKLDDTSNPSALALPFKTGGFVSLISPYSENVFLKYYATASRCILHSSPESCRHTDFTNFNNEIWHWMKRDVAPHLFDEKLYAAYGGVLRIAATVHIYGKDLSRRNLFEYPNTGLTKWHPWNMLTQPKVYINNDWSPKVYVLIVILVAIIIYLLQVCFNYVFCDTGGCRCTESMNKSEGKEVAYTNVESNIPAILPHQSAVYYSDKKRLKRSASRTKTTSLGSFHTQKVYDLNENTEKLMAVIMSDKDTTSPHSDDAYERIKVSNSPPILDASMSQLQIDRAPPGDRATKTLYSTSTMSRSDVTYCQEQEVSESWSDSGSSTSATSISSTTSKTRTRRSKSSRDLAWARRIVSKQSYPGLKSASVTELDVNSFTTPPSHR